MKLYNLINGACEYLPPTTKTVLTTLVKVEKRRIYLPTGRRNFGNHFKVCLIGAFVCFYLFRKYITM